MTVSECTIIGTRQELNMAVVNHPNPPYLDGDGNADWPECNCDCQACFYRDDMSEHPGCKYGCGLLTVVMEDLGDSRSIGREFGGGCATCNGGGCGDCR